MNGIVNIYKERGYTSHDVIARLRGITRQRKMGHTGTLDPDAEGVLPVCLGTATRVCDIITEHSKCYEVAMLLGIGTDSQDVTGELTGHADKDRLDGLTDEMIINTISSFTGEYDQLPPMYSAVRMGGQRLYEIARAGKEIERKTRRVSIDRIETVSDPIRGRLFDGSDVEHYFDNSSLKAMEKRIDKADRRFERYTEGGITEDFPVIRIAFKVRCSKGTYIRSLCSDIGDKLGVFGCVERLMRTRVDIFDIDDAITLAEAEKYMADGSFESRLHGAEELFAGMERLDVKEKYDELLMNGNLLYYRHFKQYITVPPTPVRVYSSKGEFLGIYGHVEGRAKYTPVKVFIEKEQ